MNKRNILSICLIAILMAVFIAVIVDFLNSYIFKPVILYDTKAPAPIDIASTFIAYVALIVSVATIILTIGGVFFTYWFSKQKETILAETSKDIAKKIATDEKARNDFFDALLKSLDDNDLKKIKNNFVDDLEKILAQKTKAATDDMRSTRVYKKRVDKKSTLEQMSGE